MTHHADVLSEQKQTTSLARELMDQEITLLALKNGPQRSAESLARSVQAQGALCSWIWFPTPTAEEEENGTAFVCLGRNIRGVDRFPLNKSGQTEKRTAHMAFGIQLEGSEDWFYCLSQTPEADLQEQWKLLNGCIVGKRLCGTVWLLGMKPYQKAACPGSWLEAADGEVWCSRDLDIHTYIRNNGDQSSHTGQGAVVIEVKE